MTIEEAKNLIENYKLNKDNYLAAIQSFQNEEKEENYKLFLKLIGFFDTCCSDEAYRNIILILENFKNKLPSTSQNLGYYYYGESLLYLYLGDRARSIEFALEAKKIEGLDPKFLYYTECFLVSALYQEGLYKEALNENNFI